MEVRLERAWSSEGYAISIWQDGTSYGKFAIASLGTMEWTAYDRDQFVPRDEKQECIVNPRKLLTFYNSLQAEMIRLGIIPRPLVEDEVKQLREQLADTQKVRDQLLRTVEELSKVAVLANIKSVHYDNDGKKITEVY